MWHNLGKVNVTKGSDVVTGVGTNWVENIRVGDAFQGPDGKLYQVINVASDEALAISPAYEGSTATNLNYWIVPIPGYSKTQADRLSLIISKLDGDIVTANDAAEAAQSAALQAQQWRNEAASSAAAALQSEQSAALAANTAQQARDDAIAVVTGGDASIDPEAGKIPLAGASGTIKQAWVEDLPFNYDQFYAQLWAARYPGIPAPSFYQEFGGGASLLDPRITFTRSGEATYIKNGRILTAGVDEPVFENGGLRVWPSVTNLLPYSDRLNMWSDHVGFSLANIGTEGSLLTTRVTVAEQRPIARIRITDVLPDVNGTIYTYTCYVKKAESFEESLSVGNANSNGGTWYVRINSDGTFYASVAYGEVIDLIYDKETGFLSFTFRADEGTDTSIYHRANTSNSQIGDPVFEIGNQMMVRRRNVDNLSAINPFVPTNGSIETKPVDRFSIEGDEFQKMFNPNQGAMVFSIGEKSALVNTGNIDPYFQMALLSGYTPTINPLASGIYFGSYTVGAFELLNLVSYGTRRLLLTKLIHPGDKVGVNWSGYKIALYVNGEKIGEATVDQLPAAMSEVKGLYINRSLGIYLNNLAMFTTAPTDAQMEGLTNA